MKKLSFYNLEGFCNEVSQWFEKLDKEEFEDIAIIAKYEEAKEIIENLIVNGFIIHSIDIHDGKWEGYVDEYIITLVNVGEGNELFCEPMKRDGKYIPDESTIIYVLGNCSSKVIPYCKGKIVYEVSVYDEDDEYDDEYDCANCVLDDCIRCGETVKEKLSDECVEYSKDEDGDMHGFTASRSDGNSYFSYSFYTSEKIGMDDIQNILKEMGF